MSSSAPVQVRNGQASTRPTTGADRAAPLPGKNHDAKGRFLPGNPGGPGNPFARQTASSLRAIREAFTEERLKEVAEMVYRKARGGDLAAAKIMFSYAGGRPAPAPEPDRLDVDEWKLSQQGAIDGPAMKTVMQRMPAECANVVLRAAMPHIGESMMDTLGRGIKAVDSKEARRKERKEMRNAERARRKAERARRRAAEHADPAAPIANGGENGRPAEPLEPDCSRGLRPRREPASQRPATDAPPIGSGENGPQAAPM